MAYETIYKSTTVTIEKELPPYTGTLDEEGNPTPKERRTWHDLDVDDPDVEDVYENPVRAKVKAKAADLLASRNSADGHTVTSGNAVATLQAIVDVWPDVVDALVYLYKRLD